MRTLTIRLLFSFMATVASVAAFTPTTSAQSSCSERYIAAPVNETGIFCQESLTRSTFRSYTMTGNGFGYWIETEMLPNGATTIFLHYQHRDGPFSEKMYRCWGTKGETCQLVWRQGPAMPGES